MSKLYRLKDSTTNQEKILVSKDYIDTHLKIYFDHLVSYIMQANPSITMEAPMFVDTDEYIDLDLGSLVSISAKNVIQDANHKMLSTSQVSSFKNKPSMFEIQEKIAELKVELKTELDNLFVNLLNMPNAVERLKKLSILLKTDDGMTALNDLIDNAVWEDEFNEHKKSYMHLTSNDRKVLNLLVDLLNKGIIDRLTNSQVDRANECHKADTLEGKSLDDIRKHQFADCILGFEEDKCTYIMSKDDNTMDFTLFNYVQLKRGKFNFNKLSILKETTERQNDLTIEGNGWGTTLACGIFNAQNAVFKNLKITSKSTNNSLKSSLNCMISWGCEFHKVYFLDCIIDITGGSNVRFEDCTFKNCMFVVSPRTRNIRITGCDLIDTQLPKLNTFENVISNNLTL